MDDLVRGVDYEVDALGRLVFTEHYNRRRGYCCFQGCRHCPWGQAGRTPAEAQADLSRRLAALQARLDRRGRSLRVRGYTNGRLRIGAVAALNPAQRAAGEAALREDADALLTVIAVEWD